MKHPGLQYQSPYVFTLKQRLMLALGAPLIASALKMLCWTCSEERFGPNTIADLIETGQRVIPAIWHETLGLAAWHYRGTGYHTLTSYSFDGELAARVVLRFGLPALRGSSSRGGRDALEHMRRATELVPAVGFTLDGPKGPPRIAKPGIAILALRAGLPVVPHAFAATKCWRMRSWDRLIIPKPRAHLLSACGPPIYPPPENTPETVESLRAEIEGALNRLHDTLDTECGPRR